MTLGGLITVYKRLISPLFGNNCRFHPSCSDYAVQVLQERGLLVGGLMAVGRIARCNPLNEGGFDYPVKR